MRKRRPVLLPVMAAAWLLGAAGAAQESRVRDWQLTLRSIGEDLREERFEAAEAGASALAAALGEEIVGGEGAAMLVGMVTAYRAMAEAGLGRREAAIWHWQVAQQLHPPIETLDLAMFSPRVRYLAEHPPRAADEGPRRPPGASPLVPPVRLHAPEPRFPGGRAFRGLQVEVVVQVVVDAEGRPVEPRILDSRGEPTLVQAALEALRHWRFDPARRDGRPVPVLYRLTVSFRAPEFS